MSSDFTTNGFRILAALGCLAAGLMLVVFVFGYLLFYVADSSVPANQPPFVTSTTSSNRGLGELGYRCGGKDRLPCGAGLVCSTESEPSPTEGVCVVPERSIASSTIMLQKDESCDLSLPRCEQNLACVPQKTGSVCQEIGTDTTLPRVLSVKLEGMSPMQGWYLALPNTVVTINVQAVNATKVTFHFGAGGGGELQKLTGGSFSGTFVVSRGLTDDLMIIASAPSGASSLSFRVASVQ